MTEPEYDWDKMEEVLLAMLYAVSFENGRFWKGYDFGMMESLYKKGYITEPWGRNKSAYLTAEGMEKAKRLADEMFAKK